MTTTLDALEARVAALEAGESNEALVPTYLSYNPTTGQVGGLFTGGLQLNAETASDAYPPPAANSIQWIRQNGALVAYLLDYSPNADTSVLRLAAIDDVQPASSAEVFLGVDDPNGFQRAGLLVDTVKGGWGNGAGSDTIAKLLYQQNNTKKLYQASDGSSDWLQGVNNLSELATSGANKAAARSNISAAGKQMGAAAVNTTGPVGGQTFPGVSDVIGLALDITISNPSANVLVQGGMTAYANSGNPTLYQYLSLDGGGSIQTSQFYFNPVQSRLWAASWAYVLPNVAQGTHHIKVQAYDANALCTWDQYGSGFLSAVEVP